MRTSLRLPIILGVIMIVMVVAAFIVGWVVLNVQLTDTLGCLLGPAGRRNHVLRIGAPWESLATS